MFVPSEIIFNDLHANFKDVVQDSYRARVWIVSPTSLMATLNAVGAITEAVEPTDDTRMKSYNTAMSAQIDALSERVRQLESNAGSAAHDEAANSSDTPAEAIEQDERSLHETSSDIEKPE